MATIKVILVDGAALVKVSLLQLSVVQHSVVEEKGNATMPNTLPVVLLVQMLLVSLQPEVLKLRFSEKTVNAVEK